MVREEYEPLKWGDAEVKILVDPRKGESFLERGISMYDVLVSSNLVPEGALRSKDSLFIALEPGGNNEPRNHCNLYSLGGRIVEIRFLEGIPREDLRITFNSMDFKNGKISFTVGDYNYRFLRSR